MITLEAILNLQNVTQLYDQLKEQLSAEEKIEIDASAVQSIDTSTLQMLIILKQSAIKLGRDISIDFPSENFLEAAELLGLADLLGVDDAGSGFF